MTSTGSTKRPPSSLLESVEKGRKMDNLDTHEDTGNPGINAVDNAVIIAGIQSSLPSVMNEIMDANMSAMEERLTTSITNMTKRLEDKKDVTNLSFTERLETLETVQDGFANRLQEYDDRIGNVENVSESNSGLHDMVLALAKRIVVLEGHKAKEEPVPEVRGG